MMMSCNYCQLILYCYSLINLREFFFATREYSQGQEQDLHVTCVRIYVEKLARLKRLARHLRINVKFCNKSKQFMLESYLFVVLYKYGQDLQVITKSLKLKLDMVMHRINKPFSNS